MSFIPQKSLSIGFKKRIAEYLKNKNRQDQKIIVDELKSIAQPLLFGGVVRDFFLNSGFTGFRSDIDIVLSNCDLFDLEKIAKNNYWIKNKFGGYRAITKTGHLDIWRIEDTWAFKNGAVQFSGANSLLETTFFNIDSIYYDINSEQIIFSKYFEDGVLNSTLNLVLPENPNQIACLNRAFKYSRKFDFHWSPFLMDHFIKICQSFSNIYGKNSIIYKDISAYSLEKTLLSHKENSTPFPEHGKITQLKLFSKL